MSKKEDGICAVVHIAIIPVPTGGKQRSLLTKLCPRMATMLGTTSIQIMCLLPLFM